jgi:hypothetical protein
MICHPALMPACARNSGPKMSAIVPVRGPRPSPPGAADGGSERPSASAALPPVWL